MSALTMDLAGDRLLANADLAEEQHRHVGAGYLPDQTEDLAHGRVADNHASIRRNRCRLLAEGGGLLDNQGIGVLHGGNPSTRKTLVQTRRFARKHGIDGLLHGRQDRRSSVIATH